MCVATTLSEHAKLRISRSRLRTPPLPTSEPQMHRTASFKSFDDSDGTDIIKTLSVHNTGEAGF